MPASTATAAGRGLIRIEHWMHPVAEGASKLILIRLTLSCPNFKAGRPASLKPARKTRRVGDESTTKAGLLKSGRTVSNPAMDRLSIETQRRLFCAGIARTNDRGVAAPQRGSIW